MGKSTERSTSTISTTTARITTLKSVTLSEPIRHRKTLPRYTKLGMYAESTTRPLLGATLA